MMRRYTLASGILTLLLAAAIAPLAAQAVPFGKNKIQYRDFDWRILSGEHVDIYYYPEEESLARLTLAYAEESYDYLERKFHHHPFERIPLIIYASDQHFEQTNVFPGFIPEGVLGFTEYLKGRVALPFRGDYAQFRHTLRHELIHVFQLSIIAETGRLHGGRSGFVPQQILWWTEGLAEFWSSAQTAEDHMFIRDMVLQDRLPTIERFSYMRGYAAYPLGAELHAYLTERFGPEYIVEMYREYWKYDSFTEALSGILGVGIEELSRKWEYALQRRHYPAYAERPPPDVSAEPIITKGGANFKPTLYTPPGDSIPDLLFLSPRTGYTNIYRTGLEEGESGLSTVVEGQRSAEFESFHAYASRIDVNERGVLAFASKYLGRDALVLWDLSEGEVVGRYQWPDLVGVKSPAWGPSGSRIVFEGLSTRGFSDLYVLDFETQRRTALTRDRYRDADPDWSPDGETIVFASDRTPFGPDGFTNLFLYDMETGGIEYLTYGRWHDRDPRWSRDGGRIAFSSDRSGFYDLYVVDRNGTGHRVTEMTGGVFEPVWLPEDRGLVFAAFGQGSYRIFEYTLPPETAGLAEVSLDPGARRVALASTAEVDSAGTAPAMGWEWQSADPSVLEDATSRGYDTWSSISIDFAAGDAVVAPGIGSAQGAQVMASDMLGNHLFFAGVSAMQVRDAYDVIDNFSGQLMYLNLSHRLNFGAGIYRFRGRFFDVTLDIYQEETYGGIFLASYPFSKFRRIELQLGVSYSRQRDLPDVFEFGFFTPDTRDDNRDLTRNGFLTANYLSYVKDNTLWLPTGPIDGERYNVSAGFVTCFACTLPSAVSGEPVTRSVAAENYVVFADYRRYFRTSLLSAYAVRLFGFFSDGAIPGRAVLGGPHHLRGYPRFTLAGSRVWLVNQEWRFPILHGIAIAFPFGSLRLPPIQGALFADAGSSWLEGGEPTGTWGSYGLALRTSLGPPFVLRLDIGRRFALGEKPPVLFGPDEEFGDTFVDFFFGFNY